MIFLCPLVFFHELGHFLFARLFGVRVEVFSLGFGPKIFKTKRGHTEYAFSIIPLGGYVKMFGDDPLSKDAVPEELRPYSFTHQKKWARFWIVFGGPLANIVLAYCIFTTLLMVGETLPEVRIGTLKQDNPLYQTGLRTGDILKSVNDSPISNLSEFMSEKEIVRNIEIERLDKKINLEVGLDGQSFFELFSKSPAILRRPLVVDNSGQYFGVSISKDKMDWDLSLDQMNDLDGISTIYLFKVDGDLKNFEETVQKVSSKEYALNPDSGDKLLMLLNSKKFFPVDMQVKSVNMDSPADKGGIKAGDIVVAINGTKVVSFDDLRAQVQQSPATGVMMSILRNSKPLELKLVPQESKQDGKDVKLIGVYSAGEFVPLRFVQIASRGFIDSITVGFERTVIGIEKTLEGFKKIIFQEVSLKNIGGPIAIGKVASDSFNLSLSYFFQIMAFISINLGLINLFPIPVLDGGHIMFILLEIVNRGPLSRRKMEIAQQFGLSLLLILTFAALINDVSRLF